LGRPAFAAGGEEELRLDREESLEVAGTGGKTLAWMGEDDEMAARADGGQSLFSLTLWKMALRLSSFS
jgi:hypothetical protein